MLESVRGEFCLAPFVRSSPGGDAFEAPPRGRICFALLFCATGPRARARSTQGMWERGLGAPGRTQGMLRGRRNVRGGGGPCRCGRSRIEMVPCLEARRRMRGKQRDGLCATGPRSQLLLRVGRELGSIGQLGPSSSFSLGWGCVGAVIGWRRLRYRGTLAPYLIADRRYRQVTCSSWCLLSQSRFTTLG